MRKALQRGLAGEPRSWLYYVQEDEKRGFKCTTELHIIIWYAKNVSKKDNSDKTWHKTVMIIIWASSTKHMSILFI